MIGNSVRFYSSRGSIAKEISVSRKDEKRHTQVTKGYQLEDWPV